MRTRTVVLAVVLLVAPIVAALLLRGPYAGRLAVTSPGAKAADPNDAWAWEDWVTAEGFITVATEQGLPALHAAAGRGDLAGVTRLLAQGGDVNARDKDGWTPLHWAAYEGQTKVMEALLAHRGDLRLQPERPGVPGTAGRLLRRRRGHLPWHQGEASGGDERQHGGGLQRSFSHQGGGHRMGA